MNRLTIIYRSRSRKEALEKSALTKSGCQVTNFRVTLVSRPTRGGGDRFFNQDHLQGLSRSRFAPKSCFVLLKLFPVLVFFSSYSLVFTKQPVLMRRKFHMNKKYKIKYLHADTYIHSHKHTITYYNVELLKISPKTRTI